MANAADKQLKDLAKEKEALQKRIQASQDRISVIETMEAALGGSVTAPASPAQADTSAGKGK